MAKYMFAYRGGTGMAETPEAQAQIMEAWGAWYGRLGTAVADGGAPFGARSAVNASGAAEPGSGLTGFSMVVADSLAAASALTAGCPVLADGGTIDIYECIDMGG